MQRRLASVLILLVCLVCLVCASEVSPQTRQITCPPGFLSKEGSSIGLVLGAYANGRNQFVDGTCKGTKMLIYQMDFRRDGGILSGLSAPGRTWTSVTLSMCELSFSATPSVTFTQNCTTTPSTVFSSSVSWPALTGPPAASPTPWGGTGGAYRFPFKSPWTYPGTRRMVSTFEFRGGTLTNNAGWTSSSPYYLDGVMTSSSTCQAGLAQGNATCNDSSLIHGFGAACTLHWCNHGPTYSTVSLRGKTAASSTSNYTAPGGSVVHAWGIPLANPVSIGAICNQLHIIPVLHFFGTASSSSTDPTYRTPTLLFPTVAATFGLRAGVQAAWSDSRTGRFSLTRAFVGVLPGMPSSGTVEKWSIYRDNLTTNIGFAVLNGFGYFTVQSLPRLTYN